MKKKLISGTTLALLLTGILTLASNIQPVKAGPATWTVDDDGPADFSKIQDAVDAASPGDTIYVYNGTYYERVLVEKAVSLKGENEEATIIDGETGAAFRLYASHVNITGFTLQGGGDYSEGIYLYTGSNWNVISSNIIKGKNAPYARGIDLRNSDGNTIKDNVIRNSTLSINLWESNGTSISNNNITNSFIGIYQQHSGESIIYGNNIAGAPANTGAGIQIEWTGRNTISNNSIMGNGYGIVLQGSNENHVSGNNIANNQQGIRIYESSGNLLYHNNFINNIAQVESVASSDMWDNGYPSGGNYWSDYNGVDIKNGPNQDMLGSDGIGDTPFVIDANNQDNYPLMTIWGKIIDVRPPVADAGPDLTVNSRTTVTLNGSKSIDDFAIKSYVWTFTDVNQQILLGIHPDYTFNNPGHFEVTLNVSDYADNWDIDTVSITVLLELELVASITVPMSLKLGASTTLKAVVTNPGPNDAANVELALLINGTAMGSTTVSLLHADDSYTLNHQWTPTVAGTYNVTAYVLPLLGEADRQNNKATEFVTVSPPQPPVASFTHSPTAPIAGNTVTFDASSSYDPDGSILSYGWEFGDGTTGSGKTAAHAYPSAGAYTVTLTVTDSEDATDTETSLITILIAPKVGVKVGDWIKCTYTISGWPAGTPYPEWLKLEFTSVEGTTTTVRVTMRMSNGTELSETVPVDIASGGQALGLSGFVIPANSTTGDSINFGGLGFTVSTATIEGETTRTYAGASRTVVYASISQYGTQLTYYWDKQTGVMVEASTTSGSVAATGRATETNMWQAQPQQEAFPIWIIGVAVAAIVLAAATVLFLRKRKQPTKNTTDSLSSA